MSIWIKPNGTEIEINDSKATTEYVLTLGWKPLKAKKPKKAE